jgi:hypothetical protein
MGLKEPASEQNGLRRIGLEGIRRAERLETDRLEGNQRSWNRLAGKVLRL